MIAETWLFATLENPVPARPLTAESVPAEVRLTPADVRVTWRGDGRYFATCSRTSAGKPTPLSVCSRHTVPGTRSMCAPPTASTARLQ